MNPFREPPPRILVRFAVGALVFFAAAVVIALIFLRPSIDYAYGRIAEVGASPGPRSSSPRPQGFSGWVDPGASPLPPSSFAGLSKSSTMGEVIARLGPAQAEIGSGLHVLQWRVTDGRVFHVSTTELEAQQHPMFVGFSPP